MPLRLRLRNRFLIRDRQPATLRNRCHQPRRAMLLKLPPNHPLRRGDFVARHEFQRVSGIGIECRRQFARIISFQQNLRDAVGFGRNAFRFAYNANGWVTNRWTPEKGNTGYTFDNVGNLKSIIYPQFTVSYAYDLLNELTNMVDAVGTTAFSYAPAGQLQSESGPWANDLVSY